MRVSHSSFTFQQVRSFVAVAEHQHISRAAATLFLTQAAVTQQVRHFEQAVGLQLLERDGRSIRLTDAGRNLAVACRAALRALEVLEDTAQSLKSLEAGSLQVGASPTCAGYYLPLRLARFTRDHPGVKLGVNVAGTSELNHNVVAGTLDCALVEGEPAKELLAVVIGHDELILVVHRDHPLAALDHPTPADLAQHRYLRRGASFSAERHVRNLLGDFYERAQMLNLGHPEYVHAAVLAGLGFAALPRPAIAKDLADGVLKALPAYSISRRISAIRRHSRGGPVQEAFWDLLASDAKSTSARITADATGAG